MRVLACLACLMILAPAAEAACRPKAVEAEVAGIRVGDAKSLRRVLGPWRTPAWDEAGADQDRSPEGVDLDRPYVGIRGADGAQELRLFDHYGGSVDAGPGELMVGPAAPAGSGVRRAALSVFTTERGIGLGMREVDLVRLLGPCHARERGAGGEAVLVYRLDDPGHPLLKAAAMPAYRARYAFRDGRLVWFRLGFPYP